MNLVEEYNNLLRSITKHLVVGQELFNAIDETWDEYEEVIPLRDKFDESICFLVNTDTKRFFRIKPNQFTYLPRPRTLGEDLYLIIFSEDYDFHNNDERPTHRETSTFAFDVNTNMCVSVEYVADKLSDLYHNAYIGNGLNLNPKSR